MSKPNTWQVYIFTNYKCHLDVVHFLLEKTTAEILERKRSLFCRDFISSDNVEPSYVLALSFCVVVTFKYFLKIEVRSLARRLSLKNKSLCFSVIFDGYIHLSEFYGNSQFLGFT